LADDRVKQVKQANDIVDVVGAYLALRPAGPTFKGLCPFHDDSRPSFDVDPRRQRYRCWACGKFGDVISFVQEFEKLSFPEALEQLARRAGIELDDRGQPQGPGRAQLIDVMRWSAKQFHDCLLDSPLADDARRYLGERGLRGDTVRRWGLGFAPGGGQWLMDKAAESHVPVDLLQTVGLVGERSQGPGHYDRFRERVLFPIRDVRGQTVGFGGRVLPGSPHAERGPKYYNSSDTPLFSKSEQLYGIDQARAAAEKAGYLAVVEGYTDVLMAHQMGLPQVVATMGTALNERHVRQIRRFVPRVVLVFDADEGGDTGVEKALQLFASHDMELAVATLPAGLDPCDLLVREGPEPLRRVLESAVDALEHTLTRKAAREDTTTVEGSRRVVDAVLGVIALAPRLPGEAGTVKTQLMINRIARRLALKEETVWARLEELRRERRGPAPHRPSASGDQPAERAAAPAALEERQLLELLLAEPALVARARAELPAPQIAHPGLRRLLEGLYALEEAGRPATLDELRAGLDGSALLNKAFELQARGLDQPNREQCLREMLDYFRRRRDRALKQQLHSQLQATTDPQAALDLLRQLQNRSVDPGPGAAPGPDEAGSDPSTPAA
jgi:DNA primase